MPLKPIPVKMGRAKHPEIATRAMAIERDADSASVAQEIAEAQAAAKALGIQGNQFWSAILSSCGFGAPSVNGPIRETGKGRDARLGHAS